MANILQIISNKIKNCCVPLIIGLYIIIFGIYIYIVLLETYIALFVIFSIYFIISSIFEIYFAINNRKIFSGWVWYFPIVIFSILKVIYLFVNPEIPITTLLLHIGFILMIYFIKGLCFSLEFKYISIKYDQYNVFKFPELLIEN